MSYATYFGCIRAITHLSCWKSSRDALASTATLKQSWTKRDAVDRERFEFVAGEYGLTVTQRRKA